MQNNLKPKYSSETADAANSNNAKTRPGTVGGITPAQLKQYIERIENLEQNKSNIASDISEVYVEAKGNGFDTKVMRQIIKMRKMDPEQRAEHQEILELYLHAIGMN